MQVILLLVLTQVTVRTTEVLQVLGFNQKLSLFTEVGTVLVQNVLVALLVMLRGLAVLDSLLPTKYSR
jgi:hypothetical protein